MSNGQYISSGIENKTSTAGFSGHNISLSENESLSGKHAKDAKPRTKGPMEYLNLYNYLTANCSTDNILDVMDARLLIEPVIAQSAAIQRDEDDMKRIKDNIDKMAECTDREKLIALDIEFHCLIAASTKNGVLPLVVHQIYSLINKVESKLPAGSDNSKETMLAYHRNILDSVSKRDAASAAEVMREHLLIAQSNTEEMIITDLIK